MKTHVRSVIVMVLALMVLSLAFGPVQGQERERVPVEEQQYIWVAANTAHPFYAEGLAGWNAAAEMLGVQANLVGPVTSDVQQQITIIEQAIANPTTAGILIYSVDDNALESVLQQAREAGIPVITGNGELRNRDIRDAFVGTANTALGATAADLAAEALGGAGQVGIVSFISAQNHQERVAGFEARIAERYPDIEILGIAPGDGTPEVSRSAATAFLQANPEVDLLWSTDASSGAVAQAIVESGMAGQVLSVGTDRTEDQIAAIQDGTVYATIVQDTFAEEFTSLNFLYWLYNGVSTVPDSCTTRPAVITADNVEQLSQPREMQAPGDTTEQQYIWVAANTAHPFYAEGLAGWNAAAEMLGVQANLVGPVTSDVQQQITIIEQAIANPTTAGILIYSVDDNALESVLQQAREAGIPVITGNGELRNRDIRDAFVGTANTALGATAADLAAEALGGAGQVGIVSFISAQNHQERVAGFEARIAERYPDIEILGIAPGDGTPEVSRSAATAFLQANPEVDLLWSTDASSGAVAQAIVESGMAGQVLSVGTDRTEDQIAAIQDGTVYATIVQDTFAEEFTSLNFLYWLYNGVSTVPDSCTTRPAVITADNVEQLSQPREMQAPGDTTEQQYIWVAANTAHPFYAEGLAGWNAAAEMLGVQANLVGPVTSDVQQQITIIEQAIANPTTAGILIYSVDDNALESVLQQAREAGIPVITGNGELRNRDIRDAFVGTANTALGATAADLAAEALGGAGQVGIVSFISAQNHQERVAGFEARIAERYPDIEILGIAPGDGTPEVSRSAATAFLQANPEVDLLWSTDASSGAVAQAIVESGMAGQVLSVGTDRTEDQIAAIQDGTVYATIVQDTFAEEFTSLNFLSWLKNGVSTVPDSCTTRPAVITADNVDSL